MVRNLVVGYLICLVVAANVGNLFFSVLLSDHPLALVGLNPSNRNFALASHDLSAGSYYVVGFLRLIAPDAAFYLVGFWYGDAAVRWMERKAPSYGELLRGLERWFEKARYPVVAIMPNNPVCLFAGAAGMAIPGFVIANVVGTVGRLILIRAFSAAFEDLLGPVRHFIADYRWPLMAVSVALVAFTMWNDKRGGRDGIGDLVHLDEGIAEAELELEAEEAQEAAVSGVAADLADQVAGEVEREATAGMVDDEASTER
jgi:membrane protein DedA with SNARE-associated domain